MPEKKYYDCLISGLAGFVWRQPYGGTNLISVVEPFHLSQSEHVILSCVYLTCSWLGRLTLLSLGISLHCTENHWCKIYPVSAGVVCIGGAWTNFHHSACIINGTRPSGHRSRFRIRFCRPHDIIRHSRRYLAKYGFVWRVELISVLL